MSEDQPNYPSKFQSQIQVENFRDTSWKKGEEKIIAMNKYLQRCQKVAALALHYENMHSVELLWAKNPLQFFGGSQIARRKAEVFKVKAQRFAYEFNIMINDIPVL